MKRVIVPPEAFERIEEELQRRPVQKNNYRKASGSGRSIAYGVVNRRCLPPDYSRNCWVRPYLYKLLLDFGHEYVKDISWNAITVNQNYQAAPHYDKNNVGDSFLVGFGDYTGGYLIMHNTDVSGTYNIVNHAIIHDFGKVLHSVSSFTGTRYSLVYYNCRGVSNLPPASVRWDIERERWDFYRGDELISMENPLPHPLSYRRPMKHS
jgi:hypothetical protein